MPKLTKRLIDAIDHPDEGQVFIRDEGLRGFALRITPGSKSFVLEKEINGRVRRMTLGKYGALTIEQARGIAIEKLAEIAKGGDPAESRQQRLHGATFGDLEKMYLERHAVHKKSRLNDVWMLKKHLARWRTRKLTAITRADVCRRHADIGKAGHTYLANRIVALLRTMFALAGDWGLYHGDNPATRVTFFKETKRDRFVKPDELPRFWTALQAEPNPYVRVAFLVGLLTGARRSEVLTMRWENLDIRQSLWMLPDTKAGRSHVLPLPRPALAAIMQLPRLDGNPFVFCGRWGRSHLVNVAKPWKRIRTEAGLQDVRIHDLRRTLGSWLVAAGASLPLIGKALGHSQPSTTAIYARLQVDPVRLALEANAERMLSVIETARTAQEDH